MIYRPNIFPFCELVDQSSPNLNFGTHRKVKLLVSVSCLTAQFTWKWMKQTLAWWDSSLKHDNSVSAHSCSCCCMTFFLLQQIQIKLGWALFVTYTIIQSIMRSEMCSLHLTHPSAHTWSSGQPTVQRPGSSHGLPFGAGIRTHNFGLPRVSSPTLYPLGQRLHSF